MVWVVIAIVCAIAGFFIGQNKGHAGLGLILGLLLGVIGLIIVALLPPSANYAAQASAGSGPSISGPQLETARADTAETRLSRLDALFASGALTEVEYQAQRQRIIGGI